MKTFVITISKTFPVYHPRKGEPTNFAMNYIKKIKKHTIRGNYAFWKKRIDQVNEGVAKLEIRQWSGKPYASKQVTLDILLKGEVDVQPLSLTVGWFGKTKGILAHVLLDDFETRLIDVKELVKNDGLDLQDFYDWFNKPLENPCVIHFTDLRY
jgi:hypothetical protein